MKLMLFILFSLLSMFNVPRRIYVIPHEYVLSGSAQGTSYTIKYLSNKPLVSSTEIDSILNQIDSSLSLYKPYSLISRFNATSKCIDIDNHFIHVLTVALSVAELSEGAFDPTCKPISELWGFGSDAKKRSSIPTHTAITHTLRYVGFKNIRLNNSTVCKTNKHIKLDCDGIAQGYSVDVLSNFLHHKGIQNYLVELGGEIVAKGSNTQNMPWTVGLENPTASYDNLLLAKKKIFLQNDAITTSGNYRKFKQYGNDYFSHIIDPIKGKPVNNGIIAVTVLAENATLADAWDNAFMILGIEKSFKKVQSLNHMGIYFLYQDENGNIRDTCNDFFKSRMH